MLSHRATEAHRRISLCVSASLWLFFSGLSWAQPTLYIIGDSTVKNGTAGQVGWGDPIAALFTIKVENRARGGRSSRTYLTEGLWQKVIDALQPGDFVLMQFGHNDGGSLTEGRGRASLKGNGEETQDITDPRTQKPETVHTYG